MLKILSRFAAFVVIGIVGYLTYSSLSEPASSLAGVGKEIPAVTKKMLNPVFLEPQEHASPADRDPFDASWDRYFDLSASDEVKKISSGSVSDGNNVHFPDELMGILTGADGQRLALIGSEVYGVGSLVKQSGSDRSWQISSIEDESVILTCNELRTVLKISDVYSDYNDVQKNISEAQEQKEPTQ
jgi:hypothetical protein